MSEQATTKAAQETHGKCICNDGFGMNLSCPVHSSRPCPGCGCPYPGDHTLDCPIPAEEQIKRLRSMLAGYKDALGEMISIANARYCGHCDMGYKEDDCTCGNYRNTFKHML